MIKFIILIVLLFSSFIAPSGLYAAEDAATFAGGCFWCLEHDLESINGVIKVESGYSGGNLENPTYRNHNGHQEVVLVKFNPEKINYENLLRSYWRNIDPLDDKGQFCDKGDSYRPIIFTSNQDQKTQAELSLIKAANELDVKLEDIKVQIKPQKKFWLAEDYHQDFAKLNNLKYSFYRSSCGRDNRLEQVWGDKASTADPWN